MAQTASGHYAPTVDELYVATNSRTESHHLVQTVLLHDNRNPMRPEVIADLLDPGTEVGLYRGRDIKKALKSFGAPNVYVIGYFGPREENDSADLDRRIETVRLVKELPSPPQVVSIQKHRHGTKTFNDAGADAYVDWLTYFRGEFDPLIEAIKAQLRGQ